MENQASRKYPWRVFHGKRLLATVKPVPASEAVEIRWAGGGISIACNLKAAIAILAQARMSKPLR